MAVLRLSCIVSPMSETAQPPVAVVGAGLMGCGIAACFAAAGHEVAVHDPIEAALAAAPERVASALAAMSGGERDGASTDDTAPVDDPPADDAPTDDAAPPDAPPQAGVRSSPSRLPEAANALARVRFESRPQDALAGTGFVFEAAPEDLRLKQEIFARLDAIAAPGCILASNSSSMRPTEIAARAEHPGRTVGTHWWNPPHLVPLVEVVRGESTTRGDLRAHLRPPRHDRQGPRPGRPRPPGLRRQSPPARSLARSVPTR